MGKVKLLADRKKREAGSEAVLSSIHLLYYHFFSVVLPQRSQEHYYKDTEHLKTETEGENYVCTFIAFSSRVTKLDIFCL